MGTLRLPEVQASPEKHQGEVFCCSYSADGAFVLSGGWDGHLRLWDAATGAALVKLSASPKPLSCCAFSPDGRQWLSGSMEGLLSVWDAVSYQTLSSFVAHTRPISAICFHPDGQTMATTSWDRQISLRKVGRGAEATREARTLAGHADIVAGCRFTADGMNLISWSHDRTIKVWDLALGREATTLTGHTDRVNTLALSPDGRWLLSGGRDSTVRLWDLQTRSELAALNVGADVRGCFALLDGESAVVADAAGRLFLLSLPSFQVQTQVQTPFRTMCGELAPTGTQLALGAEDGVVYFVAVEGLEDVSLVVTARQSLKENPSVLGRFFGSTKLRRMYEYTCPACRQTTEVTTLPPQPVACRKCRRSLRVNGQVPVLSA